MISKPTTPQLIEKACSELADKVRPSLDGTTLVVLDMAIAVLGGAARRSASEQAWMAEESDAIEAVALSFVADLPNATALAAALKDYQDHKSDSRYLADAEASYERASEVLSCLAEAAYADGDQGRKSAVHVLFDQRMANENAVIGAFLAVGRSA